MLEFHAYSQHIETLFAAALAAAEPASAVRRYLRRDGDTLFVGDEVFDIATGQVHVVSVGKAALPMGEAAVAIVGDALANATVISKKNGALPSQSDLAEDSRVRLLAGNHPISGAESIAATQAALAKLEHTRSEDLVLCLISGGASALLTQPVIDLAEWQRLTDALLASGCTINELNTIRRRLDRVKGGGLARLAAPASCASLILSDVVGNPLEAIGSGPTVLVEETAAAAAELLDQYHIDGALGEATSQRIRDALRDAPADHAAPPRNEIVIVGDVRRAAEAAARTAADLGFSTQILTVRLEGEAREVGRVVASIAKDAPPGSCLILGGETTVTVRGDGQGGRNLETALAAAIALDGWPNTAIASLATDGEDGPTPAAGAVVAGWTAETALAVGLSPIAYLERNDSYAFFRQLDAETGAPFDKSAAGLPPPCLFVTGSTGTNVNDLVFLLTYDH